MWRNHTPIGTPQRSSSHLLSILARTPQKKGRGEITLAAARE
jgi:hypothetical protein